MSSDKPKKPRRPNINRDPDHLLSLQFIPFRLLKYIPEDRRPGPLTEAQKKAIRGMLNMRKNQPFNRCRGKSHIKLNKLKKAGDLSHVDKSHFPCELCRCDNVGGSRTKGDFYGLGVETGMYGVGYCATCIEWGHIMPNTALQVARRDVEMMRTYGSANNDTEYALKVQEEEAALAKQRIKAREEFDLVRSELAKLAKELEEGERPEVYVNGGKEAGMILQPVDDVTLFKMRMQAAEVLSKLRIDDLKLSADQYIHVDYIKAAAQECQQAVREAISKTQEMVIAKEHGSELETDKPIEDYVWDIFAGRWVTIWQRAAARAGIRKGGGK